MTSCGVMEAERDKYSMINFEETELRLGLSLSANEGGESSTLKNNNTSCSGFTAGKRCFTETNNTSVDLKLNLSSNNVLVSTHKAKEKNTATTSATSNATPPPLRANDPAKPPAAKLVLFFLLFHFIFLCFSL